jgi:hypothetical protein
MNQGLIKLILLIIIAAVVLGYFNINLRSIWNSDAVQNNLGFLWDSTQSIWHNYLAKPADFIWGVFYNYIWLSFIENMERIKGGEDPTFMDNAPTL